MRKRNHLTPKETVKRARLYQHAVGEKKRKKKGEPCSKAECSVRHGEKKTRTLTAVRDK